MAPKWGLKTRSEKRVKKGAPGKCEKDPLGPLKELESSNQKLADGH